MPPVTLDASGMRCPMPIIEAARALRPLEDGALLEIIATDAAFVSDVRAFCETAGHELLGVEKTGDERWRAQLRKGKAARR